MQTVRFITGQCLLTGQYLDFSLLPPIPVIFLFYLVIFAASKFGTALAFSVTGHRSAWNFALRRVVFLCLHSNDDLFDFI